MDDVLGDVLIAARDEALGAGEQVVVGGGGAEAAERMRQWTAESPRDRAEQEAAKVSFAPTVPVATPAIEAQTEVIEEGGEA